MSSETNSSAELPLPHSASVRSGSFWTLLAAGILTFLICAAVMLGLPLWGRVAWGVHEVHNWLSNLPLLGLLAALWGLHAFWTRPGAAVTPSFGKVAALCGLAFALGLSARVGENAGLGRFAIITVNPASGGFYEAAYGSQNDPNWLQHYPDLMKTYHHVHSHPPMGVALMRWWLAHRSPSWTAAADNLLALSPGTNCAALAQFCAGAWKHPYTADDIGVAFWAGLMWLAFAALVPAGAFVATNALFGPRAGYHSAALCCAIPSLILFVPGADLSYVFFAVWALALAVIGFQNGAQPKGKLALAAGGAVAAVGVTGSFAGAWSILVISLFLALRGGNDRKTRLTQATLFGGAAVVTLLVFQILGINWLLLWHSVIAFNVDPDVPPVLRFIYHLADFFVFFGLAATALLFSGCWKTLRPSEADEKREAGINIRALTLPTLGLVLLLNTIISMAETARIWMLFLPLLIVACGGILQRFSKDEAVPQLANWILALQVVQTFIFVVFINVWSL